MISIKKEQLLHSIELKVIGIGVVNAIVGIALFAFQFALLNKIHSPVSSLYLGPQQIGLTDLLLPIVMASITYCLCNRFATKWLGDQLPTAKLMGCAFLALSFYCCFALYILVCLLADPETRFSAQSCYPGLLLTALLNAILPIGEILWFLRVNGSNKQIKSVKRIDSAERLRLVFIALPAFVFLFAIPWLTYPHLILLVVPSWS
jgi:hypothetical protein